MLFFPITVGVCYDILAKRRMALSRPALRLAGLRARNRLRGGNPDRRVSAASGHVLFHYTP